MGNKKKKPLEPMPFVRADGTTIYPVHVDDSTGLRSEPMTADELMKMSHKLSDAELNKVLNRQIQDIVDAGAAGDWPEDDGVIVMWFVRDFITDEMREIFPYIAREYLNNEPMIGQIAFEDVPIPHMMEKDISDAYNYRVLALMLLCARKGSVYSRNFLISLYKMYYKREYKWVKRLQKLTYLDMLEIFDEDCREKGYSSAHTTDGKKSFSQQVIEKRMQEAGWTNVLGKRTLSPTPTHRADENNEDVKLAQSMGDAPGEPPLDPVASRLFIMCELMNIDIDVTCNVQANQICKSMGALLRVRFDNEEEIRRLVSDVTEQNKRWVLTQYPEMAAPIQYQSNERYAALELSERVMYDAFDLLGRSNRIPYDSRKFDLADEIANVMLLLDSGYPELAVSMNDMLYLAMIRYLSECICDGLIERDEELDSILHMTRRRNKGEWTGVAGEKVAEQPNERGGDERAVRLFHTVESLQGRKEKMEFPDPAASNEENTDEDIAEIKARLAEKEAALAEMEQKAIRQRALYESAHKNELELKEKLEAQKLEHTELIALREYVYGLRVDHQDQEDISRDEMIAAISAKKVAILGGTVRWGRKMKQVFPEWTFIPVEDASVGAINALDRSDYIYIYTDILKHAQYYKAMDIIRKGEKILFYLGTTNMDENIPRFYRDLCEHGI